MKEQVLAAVRAACAGRQAPPHPGPLETGAPGGGAALLLLAERLRDAGAEVHRFLDEKAAAGWLANFARDHLSATVAPRVPDVLRPDLPMKPPAEASLGVSLARAAAAESGSLLLESREGRLLQLLVSVHLIWVEAGTVAGSLQACLSGIREDLPAAAALHSGPSKSADIGQIMVQGVHGPGRLVVGIVGAD